MTQYIFSIYDRLLSAGVSEGAAKEHARIVEDTLVTKCDLRPILREMELRLKLYIGGVGVAIVGVLSAIKFF